MTRWEILVASLCRRAEKLERLLDLLLPQVDECDGDVRVTVLRNRGERPLGEVRQRLVEDARADYVNFVDDDDLVSPDFVATIYPLLVDVDYVGWRMQAYINNGELKPTYHSLRYGGWSEDESGYYRDVSHLNPIRRDIALQGDFRRGDPPEDVGWAFQLTGVPKTEAYCGDRVMYRYYHSSSDSTWRPGAETRDDSEYASLRDYGPNLRWHEWSTC